MPIRFDCEFCGKTLKADDSKAGKKVKCPSCEGLLTIPKPETEPEEEPEIYDAEDATDSSGDDMDDMDDAPVGKIPCPKCGEMKSKRAKVCPWCGDGSTKKKKSKFPLAGPGKRLLGAIADGLAGFVFVGPGVVLFIAAGAGEGNNDSPLLPIGIILIAIGAIALLVVQLYLLINRSQSIGKYLVKTQIFDYETRTPAGFVKTFLLRGVVNQIIASIPCVGPLYALIDPFFVFSEEHRCLHDLIAGTYVVDIS